MALFPITPFRPLSPDLDLSPLRNALAGFQKGTEQAYEGETARQMGSLYAAGKPDEAAKYAFTRGDPELGMRTAQFAAQQAEAVEKQKERAARSFAKMGEFILAEKDPATQRAMFERWKSSHPKFSEAHKSAGFPPELADDPVVWARYWGAIASKYRDPLEKESLQAGIAAKRAEAYKDTGLGEKARRGEVLDEAIAKLIRESIGAPAGAPPAPTPSPVRPQSMPGGQAAPQPLPIAAPDVTTTDPNIIRTQAAPTPPPAQSKSPSADDETIVTPYGTMTRGQARKIGGALLLGGKPDAGKVLLEMSGAGAERFGKEGGNLIDKKTIDATSHLARLRSVEQALNPKFLQIPQRLGFAWDSLKAKVGQLKPEQAQPLAEFAEFRRASVENMSRLLNELSGAAVSPQEYERIRNTQPDAGTGIFDGDDPVTFEAKMRGVIRDQKRAIARYNYLRMQGPQAKAPWDVMGLDEIDRVINKRGAELNQQLRQTNPQASPAVIEQEVKARLAREFGIEI